jgi:hypothetical protein
LSLMQTWRSIVQWFINSIFITFYLLNARLLLPYMFCSTYPLSSPCLQLYCSNESADVKKLPVRKDFDRRLIHKLVPQMFLTNTHHKTKDNLTSRSHSFVYACLLLHMLHTLHSVMEPYLNTDIF